MDLSNSQTQNSKWCPVSHPFAVKNSQEPEFFQSSMVPI